MVIYRNEHKNYYKSDSYPQDIHKSYPQDIHKSYPQDIVIPSNMPIYPQLSPYLSTGIECSPFLFSPGKMTRFEQAGILGNL